MTSTELRELAGVVAGRVLFDEPLAGYTSYRIGGPAAALVLAESPDDVVAALCFAAQMGRRWLALGLGSNVLIADAGFDGIVIRLGKGMDQLRRAGPGAERQEDEAVWYAGAGQPTPLLARRTAKLGLGGVHRLIGVPGTVGGGVFMNAGAHGQEFSQVVRSVDVAHGDGTVTELRAAEIDWRYRHSGLDDAVVLGTTLELTPGDPAELLRDVRRLLAWRKAGTPFSAPCCGSVFRNPAATSQRPARAKRQEVDREQRTAGRLIDAAGLKGFRVGGAEVSTKHANYIVNVGGATAADVLAVIDHVRQRVMQEFGVELELEVQVIV